MKHLFLLPMILIIACSHGGDGVKPSSPTPIDSTFTNPLLTSGPDPWVIQQDTMYYYMNTLGNRLAIWPTGRMSNLSKAVPVTIWNAPAAGPYSKEIWAPELHRFNNKWYMYFAGDDGNNNNHRIYVLENDNADPTSLAWTFKGKVADTTADRWAIDASAFEYNNKLYLIWSGWADTVNTAQNIYIAQLSDPTTIQGKRVLLSSPTLSWETVGAPPSVNEGPEALISPTSRLFLTYSASGCWTDSYCLGLLALKAGGDPLNPADWTKSQSPVFTTSTGNGAVAPGHNGFFVSRAGNQNWLIYHANDKPALGCGSARSPRMQQFTWNSDGTPNFGTPVKINTPITKPSGE
ncbi:MAG TPA: glycoside hydrolase family 43 protein [Puia sp.]|nr:glycoside hydrolase family 43 protein [Puia sp.]